MVHSIFDGSCSSSFATRKCMPNPHRRKSTREHTLQLASLHDPAASRALTTKFLMSEVNITHSSPAASLAFVWRTEEDRCLLGECGRSCCGVVIMVPSCATCGGYFGTLAIDAAIVRDETCRAPSHVAVHANVLHMLLWRQGATATMDGYFDGNDGLW